MRANGPARTAEANALRHNALDLEGGARCPEHWHTAAEEIVFMLQGECDVRLGNRDFKIGPGQTLFIPQGVKHEVANTGWEPVVYVCSFSASMRGTLFENPAAPGVRPLFGRSGSHDW